MVIIILDRLCKIICLLQIMKSLFRFVDVIVRAIIVIVIIIIIISIIIIKYHQIHYYYYYHLIEIYDMNHIKIMFMIIKNTITIVINIIVTIDVFIDKPRFDFNLYVIFWLPTGSSEYHS